MRRLRATGSTTFVSPSSSTRVYEHLVDSLVGYESDVSQIVDEYNAEVWAILSTLPQGVAETRWDLPDDTINPRINNLDGANILVDTNANRVTDGGRYFRTDLTRPKTIKEAVNDLHALIANSFDSIRTEVSENSGTGSGISSLAKARIGNAIFDDGTSASTSLDGKTSANQSRLLQLAKDIYDDGSGWSWTGDGSGLLNNYSLRDMVNSLLTLHQGSWDTDISLTHSALGVDNDYSRFTISSNSSTTATSETVCGSINFDPTQYDGALTGYVIDFSPFTQAILHLEFQCAIGLIGSGTSPATVRLYDMGAPGSLGSGDLIAELDSSSFTNNTTDKATVSLAVADVGASLTWSTNEILNSERMYEVRMLVGPSGTPGASDVAYLGWAGFVVTDNPYS